MSPLRKTLGLLLLTSLVAGCQSSPPPPVAQPDDLSSLRCWGVREQKSITREQLDYIRALSKNGDPVCTLMLGDLYERGHGVAQDTAQAKALYQAVADQDPSAYYQLGRMADDGVGEPPDYFKARAFYQRAAAKPGNPRSEFQLARLLEDGKGGPRDLQGALALYLRALKYSEDEPWKGIQRLRAQSLVLNSEQQQRVNEVWVSGTRATLRRKIETTQKTLSKTLQPVPPLKPLKFQLEYIQDAATPKLTLLESSGNSPVDQAVLQAMSTYRFSGEPILPAGQKSWKVIASVVLGSQ
ncbi:sel1 repeat family protein [Pseudomonas sp. MAFF 302030]|uniref:Sel1 repeat family protein n=1 Tax=Pseudomonas morbosilactucae TaxID=2938197 RepID=A0A9X2C6C3_9PSED|nr:sel1 repeat family protein [Pseudomonas morbosilactucae]MCK9798665.1 sel1 repeat family protein [Pseudomonas morbosilactucae]